MEWKGLKADVDPKLWEQKEEEKMRARSRLGREDGS